ncbi:ABC transporter family substrate-binding protein [Streptomyces sp. NBRC 14336]|uniref:ABC transporter family substrate-binding protein n=1 Tax=Streptomyces sp. NBRC 14336 TaxID=3030992 RepID=UPI0025555CEE|nr:ABC transporter family substrate-binding protein [Streptomyces sp. NBRC 14336]
MSHDGPGPRAVARSVAFLTAGALAVPLLAGCASEDPAGKPLAGPDIVPAARSLLADGGTLRWAVDSVPETLNTFQADADATTTRVAQAVLPSMYRLDDKGQPEINPDYLESAKVVETEPKQVVLYKLNQQAVWSDGREIGAADFAAQWRALSGKDSAYWTARNAGYDRIQRIERGANDLEVKVTFARPYADWRSLFSPLYPKEVMGTPDSFNDSARRRLRITAGPFVVRKVDRKDDEITLARNPRWWGSPAKLEKIVLRAVPRDERAEALAEGELDLAEIDPGTVRRMRATAGAAGEKAKGGKKAGGEKAADGAKDADAKSSTDADPKQGGEGRQGPEGRKAGAERLQPAFKGYEIRRSLEPAFTQLALNGSEGPLADERVRRAVARALDREEIAKAVLGPLGLPAEPVGSHLALAGQAAYADNSGALGDQDTAEARALLADAGWVRGGPIKEEKGEKAAGAEKEKGKEKKGKGESGKDDGTYVVGEDDKAPAEADREKKRHDLQQGSAPGAYAPKGTAAPAEAAAKTAATPAGAAAGPLAKDGKPLTLRFVLPSGPGSESLRTVAERIRRMLDRVGIRTELTKVKDESYFKDHIASGEYDLALYSWPASAYPATDARPIYAKPVPAADGSLNVEQNYTRVGTDQVDQLFEQAISTLSDSARRNLIRKADSRIWAAAGSIPLYQRPQLLAARKNLANTGAFGFRTPVYEDMGFLKKGARPGPGATAAEK